MNPSSSPLYSIDLLNSNVSNAKNRCCFDRPNLGRHWKLWHHWSFWRLYFKVQARAIVYGMAWSSSIFECWRRPSWREHWIGVLLCLLSHSVEGCVSHEWMRSWKYIPQPKMNYTRILLVQRQEELEETLLSKLTTFEHAVVVDELAHIESTLSELRQVRK